ncbi:DUF2971 domain-containing protein [Marinicella sp. S1101]|uniref:DUF2971 domain-containing protein n=1 Tax=Marinicella marina TaxID=2996016 RepID=UPI002260ACFC|nr:DUF2971 domain-containing protein [Marinicella marina]MCX7554406.1 DUF2971 domain-containing protein [Marinicella marina]MDJ1140557.1 DUF2971 domain-containing protein [Marinicella marina]
MKDINETIHEALWSDHDSEAEFPNQTPLLAHYTSITNFDCIVNGDELWFSNPLNMNDSDELIFGMSQGSAEFKKNEALIRACGSETVFARLMDIFDYHFNHFDKNHVLDTYISCFSQHSDDDFDGSLSMWRGYGADGNGISFVIDTKKIEPNEESPIILAPVNYATNEDRISWINQRINQLADLLNDIEKSEEVLNSIAWNWIERLKVFSLFTKHRGFQEEKEWRFVYLSDRDSKAHYPPMFGYHISNKGVEPKLKLKLGQIPSSNVPLTLESLIDRVILGPTASSVLSMRSLARMLEIKGKHGLIEKVHASSIPYRP